MKKRDELMVEHEHLKSTNANELYAARLENQGKLNDEREKLYPSYKKPVGPVNVEDSIIYSPQDDDDGDDDDAAGDDHVELEDENVDPHLPEYESTPDEPNTSEPNTSDPQQHVDAEGDDHQGTGGEGDDKNTGAEHEGDGDDSQGDDEGASKIAQKMSSKVKFAKLSTHLSEGKLITDSVKKPRA